MAARFKTLASGFRFVDEDETATSSNEEELVLMMKEKRSRASRLRHNLDDGADQ